MTALAKGERGQATVLTLAFLTVLLGMAAFVLDVGAWYRADRAVQATADAAALAGAQGLPDDPTSATSLARAYAAKNGGGLSTEEIFVSSDLVGNDTIRVRFERPASGVFTRLFGIESIRVGARATARVEAMTAAKWAAPIVVNIEHPELHCGGTPSRPVPCFGEPTQIDLIDLHKPGGSDAAGAFGLINLYGSGTGNAGASTLAEWVSRGYEKFMDLGSYDSVPSTNFNNSQFLSALDGRIGTDLLFPIYDRITKQGTNAIYNVVGWIGFRVTSYHAGGSQGWVRGWFTKVYWEGIQSDSASQPDFGARTIQLID